MEENDEMYPFTCQICCNVFNKETFIPTAFACGHVCCVVCVEALPYCHICRQPIGNKPWQTCFALRDGALRAAAMLEELQSLRACLQMEGQGQPRPAPAPQLGDEGLARRMQEAFDAGMDDTGFKAMAEPQHQQVAAEPQHQQVAADTNAALAPLPNAAAGNVFF